MDSIIIKKILMGSAYVPPVPKALAKLTFTNNSTNNVIDNNFDVVISDTEARSSITAGQNYTTVKSIGILYDCVSVGSQAFRNYPGYEWNPINGVDFTSATNLNNIESYSFANFTSTYMSPEIVISSNITNIGSFAFGNWINNLNGIDLTYASSLTHIGSSAFYGWRSTNMSSDMNIHIDATQIGQYAFANWSTMSRGVVLKNSYNLQHIFDGAFSEWVSAKNMDEDLLFPMNVVNIYTKAFYNWNSMTNGIEFAFGSKISEIGSYAFANWKNSNSTNYLYIPNSVRHISEGAFSGWEKSTKAPVIPFSSTILETIGNYAFYNWYAAIAKEDIIIPKNLLSIGDYAFANWEANTYGVVFRGMNNFGTRIRSIGFCAFSNWYKANNVTELSFDYYLESIGDYAFSNWYSNTTGVDFTYAATRLSAIGNFAFKYWDYANMTKDLNIPSSIKTIGTSAFQDWHSMTYGVDLSNATGLSIISDGAFSNWKNSNSPNYLVIPDDVVTIGNNSFANWEKYVNPVSFNATSKLTTIGDYAFYNWTSASTNNHVDMEFVPKLQSIGDYAFANWGSMLDSITFEYCPSLSAIGNHAFENWIKADSWSSSVMIFPPSLKTIGANAFNGWVSTLSLPVFDLYSSSTLISIGDYAFANWESAGSYVVGPERQLVIPNSVTTIGKYAFSYWTNMVRGVQLSNSLTSIPERAFSDWRSCNNEKVLVPLVITTPKVIGVRLTSFSAINSGTWDYHNPNPSMDIEVTIGSKGITLIKMVNPGRLKSSPKGNISMDRTGGWLPPAFSISSTGFINDIKVFLLKIFTPELVTSIVNEFNVNIVNNNTACHIMSYNGAVPKLPSYGYALVSNDNDLKVAQPPVVNQQVWQKFERDRDNNMNWYVKWSGGTGCGSILNTTLGGPRNVATCKHPDIGTDAVEYEKCWSIEAYPCGDTRPSCDDIRGGRMEYFVLNNASANNITYLMTMPLIIPNGVINIGDYAFSSWTYFKGKIILSNTLSYIGKSAFANWYSSEGIDYDVDFNNILKFTSNLISIGERAFVYLGGIHTIYFTQTTPPTFGGEVFKHYIDNPPFKVIVPATSNLSQWKAALTGNGVFASINGTSWASIP